MELDNLAFEPHKHLREAAQQLGICPEPDVVRPQGHEGQSKGAKLLEIILQRLERHLQAAGLCLLSLECEFHSPGAPQSIIPS